MDKRELYDSVRTMNARAEACGILGHEGSPESPDSKRTYTRIWQRDQAARTGMEGVSGRSWFVHKAALSWGLSEAFRKAKTAQGQAQRRGDFEGAQEIVREALELLDRWEAVRAAEKPQRAPQTRSKRRHVPKDDMWQAEAWEAAREQHKAAVAVLWATGCRPVELEKGVAVSQDQDGDAVVTIRGGKERIDKRTGAQIGQPFRQITVSRWTLLGQVLKGLCQDDRPRLVQANRSTLKKELARIGTKLGLKHRLSGYVFRHQFGGDMKADGDQEATAKALGHVSGLSQQRYGHRKQAKNGTVVGVRATRPVVKLGTRFETRKEARMEGPGL